MLFGAVKQAREALLEVWSTHSSSSSWHGWQTSSVSWCPCFVWIPWSFSGRPELVFLPSPGSGPSFIPVRQNNTCVSLPACPGLSARSLHWEHSLFVCFFPSQAQESGSRGSSSSICSKKKAKFVSLYTREGQDRLAVLIPGRHSCECLGQKHKLISNCLECGRIVCEQEGSGPCLFCGALVSNQGAAAPLGPGGVGWIHPLELRSSSCRALKQGRKESVRSNLHHLHGFGACLVSDSLLCVTRVSKISARLQPHARQSPGHLGRSSALLFLQLLCNTDPLGFQLSPGFSSKGTFWRKGASY